MLILTYKREFVLLRININIIKKGGCTRLADMLPSKYEDNTLQIKEKKYRKNCFVFLYSKLPPVLPPIFWVSIPIRQHCSTVKSARLSTIIWPWLPMRFSRALSSWTKAISADGVKADVVAGGRKSGYLRHSETQRTSLYRCRKQCQVRYFDACYQTENYAEQYCLYR